MEGSSLRGLDNDSSCLWGQRKDPVPRRPKGMMNRLLNMSNVLHTIEGTWRNLSDFFLKPAYARPIAVLRIGLAVLLLAQAATLASSAMEFLSSDGIVQGAIAEHVASRDVPQVSWFVQALSPFQVSESATILAICWSYVLGLVFLGTGLFTRVSAGVVWFLHWTLMNTAQGTTYGVDLYAHVFLFYLIFIPAGAAFSLDLLLKGKIATPSSNARLGLRLLQLHLCITYLCSGLEKAKSSQWWNGELLWRALSLPVYFQYDVGGWLLRWPLLAKVGGWMTLLMEIGYCIFIWPRRTRWIWITGMVTLHLGIAIFLGLGFFGVIMCLLTPAVFGISAEPADFSLDSRNSTYGKRFIKGT